MTGKGPSISQAETQKKGLEKEFMKEYNLEKAVLGSLQVTTNATMLLSAAAN